MFAQSSVCAALGPCRRAVQHPHLPDEAGAQATLVESPPDALDEPGGERVRVGALDEAIEERAAEPAGALDRDEAGPRAELRDPRRRPIHLVGRHLDDRVDAVRARCGQLGRDRRLVGEVEA